MKLKWQITIIAILSLIFPWVVWQSFIALNQTFQNNMLESAAKQAQIIVNSVQQFAQSKPNDLEGMVATPLGDDVAIDGNEAEWLNIPWYEIDSNIKYKIGISSTDYHLLVDVKDNSIKIDPLGLSDRLVIAIGSPRGINKYTINRQAEGSVLTDMVQNDIQAFWHELADGYQVELKIPETEISRLGIASINEADEVTARHSGHLFENQIQLQTIFKEQNHWHQFLQQITPDDGELKILDPAGRTYYQTQSSQVQSPEDNWLTELIYEFAFDQNKSDGSHFFGQRVTENFEGGSIELTIKHDAAQTALIDTFIDSIWWIFMIALALLLGYFIYALILAWRIRRLNNQLQTALDDRGHIEINLPSNSARDEIGDLSRGMSSLLTRINEYTEYLKQLGSRLSHEMKTPISIVSSSLENLHMEQPDNPFVERALNANHRLKFILNQLSALSQLKQVIAETKEETFNLDQLINELTSGYRSQAKHITYHNADRPIMIKGSQELIAQMLDKLIQNALEFTTTNDQIDIKLYQSSNQFILSVVNTGSQIATDKIHQLFDSLTSFRDAKSSEPHLGLGLYIAKLISDYHQAEITAVNHIELNAVEFKITGPVVS